MKNNIETRSESAGVRFFKKKYTSGRIRITLSTKDGWCQSVFLPNDSYSTAKFKLEHLYKFVTRYE